MLLQHFKEEFIQCVIHPTDICTAGMGSHFSRSLSIKEELYLSIRKGDLKNVKSLIKQHPDLLR